MSEIQNPWSSSSSDSSGSTPTISNPWSTPGALTSITPTRDLSLSDVQVPSIASQMNAASGNAGSGSGFGDFFSKLGQGFANATSFLPRTLETIGEAVGDPLKSLVTGQPVNTFQDIANTWSKPGNQAWSDMGQGLGQVYKGAQGALQGGMGAAYASGPTILSSLINGGLPRAFGNALSSVGQGISHGWENPTQENQSFEQNLNTFSNTLPKSVGWAPRFVANALTDPLIYTPIGAAGWALKGASDLVGATPYITSALDALKSTAPVQAATDALGGMFKKYYGTSSALPGILNQGANDLAAHQYNILNTARDLANTHGLSPEEFNQIGHVIEGTMQGTPAQQSFANLLSNLEKSGVGESGIGSDIMARTPSNVNGDMLLQNQIPNHFSHMYNNIPGELKGILPKGGGGEVSGLNPNGTFNMPRTFGTLQDAINAGLKPELNPVNVTANSLNRMAKAYVNNDIIGKIKNTPGILFEKDPLDEINKLWNTGRMNTDEVKSAMQQMGFTDKDMKPGAIVQSKIPQLRGSYIRASDERALNQFLSHEPKNTLYDKALGQWKNLSLMNPVVHGHNIGYNGMYLGGAKPSYIAEHLGNIVKGQSDPWVERAIRAGAVSQDASSFAKELGNASGQNPILKAIDFARHGALWDTDKAMRTSIFRQGVEGGMSDATAAAKANKFMGNYNNLTPFEQKVMTRVFPFYNWMKSNLPLQAEQWINNPMKQNLPGILKNAISEDLSGQPSKDGKIDTGRVLSDGSHLMIDPYLPVDEPYKALRDGVLPFLFGKVNPLLKEAIDQATNHAYYPGSTLAPNGKESMGNIPIRIQGAPESYNLGSSLAHTLNQINPISGSAVGNAIDARNLVNGALGLQTKDKPGYTSTELATKLLGGFSSRDNPQKDAYYDKKNQQTDKQGYLQYLRQTGQPVTKAMKKDAYRKIPFPQSLQQGG